MESTGRGLGEGLRGLSAARCAPVCDFLLESATPRRGRWDFWVPEHLLRAGGWEENTGMSPYTPFSEREKSCAAPPSVP